MFINFFIKKVTRLNIMLENETMEMMNYRKQKSKEKREEMLFFIMLKDKIGEAT